jgi:hypothetical protein
VIDKQRTHRAFRRSLIGLVAIAALVAPALANAAVFEGSQTDPTGDVVSWDINGPGFPRTTGPATMDLTGASVRYDSGAGLLSFTFSGSAFVYSHSATSFHGWLSSVAHQPAGTSPCGLGGSSDNPALFFNGSSSTGSGGGLGRGGATLSIMNGVDDPTITGTASFPLDWPSFANVVTFTFLDARLAHHTYQCALGLWAQYGDHGASNLDQISDFCIVAGCFDPLESADQPPPVASPLLDLSPPTLNRTSVQPGDTIRASAELKNPNSTTVTARRALITARPPGSTHANGPIKYDFPAETNISLAHGDVWVSSGSFTLPSNAPLGRYDVYLTYQTADGLYDDGPVSFFDVSADGSRLPFDTGPPTVNATVTNTPGASVIDARCSILPGKIKATTARMKLMQRASHKGSASHRRAVTRQVGVLATRRTTQRATYKALCT